MPDCLNPPQGVCGEKASYVLILLKALVLVKQNNPET